MDIIFNIRKNTVAFENNQYEYFGTGFCNTWKTKTGIIKYFQKRINVSSELRNLYLLAIDAIRNYKLL